LPTVSVLEDSTPQLLLSELGPVASARGDWTAAALSTPQVWPGLQRILRSVGAASEVRWDLTGLSRLDHLGAQLLWNQWGRRWPDSIEVHPSHRAVLENVARFTQPPPAPEPVRLWQRFLGLGEGVLQVLGHGRDLVRLIGQLFIDLGRLLRAPHEGPWRDVSGHLYHIGATAMPITALVGFLIGVVLAYLTSQQLRQFGADAFIVDILGLSLIRELGPVLAAVLVAGRSGSAITAQIGVMRVTEELDAMRVMGIPHGFRLVMPRAMALAVVMPLITVWTTLCALMGGMLAADLALGITPAFFYSALPKAVEVANLSLAMGKSAVFGVLIALIGCHYGLRVKPNTESLGQGTTASVVTSITVVILVDALFAVVFKDVGL
jgi:phospholipid/cholesterol/gamma-HCH transport system permease protein